MPFSAIYCLLTILIVSGIFAYTLYRRSLKAAIILSLVSFGTLAITFLGILVVALNNMG